ncbi:MAG: DUF5009 domain-containing protein [bacterium]|nr:DUF5009 domain-containing protein [bacterium]
MSAGAADAAPAGGDAAAGRWLGLDALRGLSIAAMILVNNPGRWSSEWQYSQLRHAAWHGCTFTDLVFPTFLFCAGVAIAPALGKQLARGVDRSALAWRIGKRVVVLVLLGMMLSAFPFVRLDVGENGGFVEHFSPLLGTRFPGVLQRIGLCYGAAALLFLFCSRRMQRLVLVLSLLLYWPLITLVPVPGIGMPDIDTAAMTLQGWLDCAVFGDHIWVKGKYDPEGLLSTLPALGTCLLGLEAGRVLAARSSSGLPGAGATAANRLLLFGLGLMVIGWLWSFALPFNKPIWTSSYAVWTAGIAMMLLGGLQHVARSGLGRVLLWPLQVYGVNALLVFVGSSLLGQTIARYWTVEMVAADGAPRTVSFKYWIFESVFVPAYAPKDASLAFALTWIAGWFVVLVVLYRFRIVWKV